uniref:Uncharacterized protein n=1 Tax=Physcomitrium patens TaxID=3218 RepID=A0A2K1L9Z3_PHYPA|nr:hypothetical protein PHYPA_001269 [Physcomitrium patens]
MAFEVDPKTSSYKPRPISYTIICPISRLLQCISYLIILVLKLIGLDVQFLFYITMRMYRMIKNVIIIYIDKVRPNPFGHTCNMFCTKKELYRHGGTSKICILIFLCSLLLHSFFDLDIYLAKRFLGGQVVIKRTLNFDYIMEHPIPIVNLLLKKYFQRKAFPTSYVFHVIVHLTLPESPHNYKIGMFQVAAKTFSSSGYSLNKARQASMLRYYSPSIKHMKNVVTGIPIMLGLLEQSQMLSLMLMESREGSENSSMAQVHIEIEPITCHALGFGIPEIYCGEWQVIAYDSHLQNVACNWVWNIYLCIGVAFFFFEVMLVLSCCQKCFLHDVDRKKMMLKSKRKCKKAFFEQRQKLTPRSKKSEQTCLFS